MFGSHICNLFYDVKVGFDRVPYGHTSVYFWGCAGSWAFNSRSSLRTCVGRNRGGLLRAVGWLALALFDCAVFAFSQLISLTPSLPLVDQLFFLGCCVWTSLNRDGPLRVLVAMRWAFLFSSLVVAAFLSAVRLSLVVCHRLVSFPPPTSPPPCASNQLGDAKFTCLHEHIGLLWH